MKKLLIVASVSVLLAWQSASALTLNCVGTVDRIWVHDDTYVFYYNSWRSHWATLCVLDTTWRGITPEACKAWFTLALTAYQSRATVQVRYDTSYPSCAEIGTYTSSPEPVLFILGGTDNP